MWSLYWRYLVALFLLLWLTDIGFFQSGLLHRWGNSVWHPTIVWSALALLFALFRGFRSRGLLYVLFGGQATISQSVWQRFNTVLISVFTVLALLNLAVYYLSGNTFWAGYKLVGSSSIVLLLPLMAAYGLTRKNNK